MVYTCELIVRYAETDQMGVAHHSHYAVWFEAARTGYLRHLGVSYTQCEERGMFLPLYSMEARFLRPARYEDVLLIRPFIKNIEAARLVVGYQVFRKETSELLCEGTTQHAWTDKNMKPVNLKKLDRDLYGLLCNVWESGK